MSLESTGYSDYSDDYFESDENTGSGDIKKVVIGALAGAAVGTLIAGAFTEKGVEIRHRVAEGGRNIAHNVKNKVSDVKSTIADKFDAVKEAANDFIDRGKRKVGLSSVNAGSAGNPGYAGDPSYAGNPSYAGGSTYAVNNAYTNEDDNSGTGTKILVGALIASVAGIIVWGLATEKGKDTRKKIAKSSKKIAGNIKEKASHIKEVIADTYQAAKDGANDLIAQEQQRTNALTGNTPNIASTGTDSI